MAQYQDSLRGYGYEVNKKDGFKCVYCGWDGSEWPSWLYLSVDHLLPEGHPDRENKDWKVTACRFCNDLYNREYPAKYRDLNASEADPKDLVEAKRQAIESKRQEYKKYWDEKVKLLKSPS